MIYSCKSTNVTKTVYDIDYKDYGYKQINHVYTLVLVYNYRLNLSL